VSLRRAQLEGALFDGAQLQGASVRRAQLQGASLRCVQLQGGLTHYTQLQDASLDGAQLEGASLDGAQLQGASFDRAQLRYASLDYAQLQRTHLAGAQSLQGASLSHILVGETDAPETAEGADVAASETRLPDGKEKVLQTARGNLEKLSRAQYNSRQDYEKKLAEWLQDRGCKAIGAPYVLHGLIRNLVSRFTQDSPLPAKLAAAFLDEKQCAGAHGLSERDKFELQDIQDGLRPTPQTCASSGQKE
jgi:hypothetical protein